MKNIEKYQNQSITKLDHILLNPPAFKESYNDVKDFILVQLIKSVTHLGWKLPDDDDVQVLITELANSVINNYKQIRKEEIATAFAKGIRGEYGEFMGLSIVTFEKFLISYLASDYRAELGKTTPRVELAPVSKELTRQDRINFANKAFDKYLETGYYNDLGNIVYDFLDSEKLIPFTASEKFEMLEEARQQEYARLQNPTSPKQARDFNKQIEALISGNEKIIPQSKRIALNRFFKSLVDQGRDLQFT